MTALGPWETLLWHKPLGRIDGRTHYPVRLRGGGYKAAYIVSTDRYAETLTDWATPTAETLDELRQLWGSAHWSELARLAGDPGTPDDVAVDAAATLRAIREGA